MEFSPNLAAFERVRDQIGSCGIWCGSCAVGNGCLTQVAWGLRELLAAYDVPQWASVEIDWESFLRDLASLKQIGCCSGCRKGSGRDSCEIRARAQARGLKHCIDCASFADCKHAAVLHLMRTGAAKAGFSVLQPGDNPDAILEEWVRALPSRWPGCIIFAEGK